MRLMLDTNAFIYYAAEHDMLCDNVKELLLDYGNTIVMSIESVRELIIAYRVKRILHDVWNSTEEMITSIHKDYNVRIIPIDMNVMRTYSRLRLNTAQDHRDPSDHVIISHAITLGVPLVSSDTKFPFYRSQGLDLIENRR